MKKTLSILTALLAIGLLGCSQSAEQATELRRFPVDNRDGLVDGSSVELDETISADGNGSFRVDASSPSVIPLYEVEGLAIDDAMLIYQARLRTENVQGQVYLEMWCRFPGMGEFFSRGLQAPLTGSNDWTLTATPFVLRKGQMPDRVRLNLVIDGTGTAWIDDVRLLTNTLT